MKHIILFRSFFKIRLILFAFVFTLLFTSCSFKNFANSTVERKDNITLGISKSEIIDIFGKPLAIKNYRELGNNIDVLIYVNIRYFKNIEYIIESKYIFENSALVKIDEEPYPLKYYGKKEKEREKEKDF